jgi:hypothetical protein
MAVERPALPGIDPPPFEEEVFDEASPFSVWAAVYFDGQGTSAYEVQARRPDGSILPVMRGLKRGEALRIVSLFRYAIEHGEEWAIKLIDVSAGKLRG